MTILHGDCRDVMATMDAASVDAIVTDPPYGIAFMGKDWDHGIPGPAFWTAALRVAKPGAYLLAFGGDRTVHRLACAIEDAGWEIRGQIAWIHGQGFPKNLNASNALREQFPESLRCSCARHSTQTVAGFPGDYPGHLRFDDAQPPMDSDTGPSVAPSPVDVLGHNHVDPHEDGPASLRASISPGVGSDRPSSGCSPRPAARPSTGSRANDSVQSGTPSNMSLDDSTATHRTEPRKSRTSRSASGSVASSWSPPDSGHPHIAHCTTCGGYRVRDGLGTALKPAMELIVMARKPFDGTVANNLLLHGTGVLNIDGCRIGTEAISSHRSFNRSDSHDGWKRPHNTTGGDPVYKESIGRWPANVVLDEDAEDRMGGASRFFYCAKASRRERSAGLDGMPTTNGADMASGGVRRLNDPMAKAARGRSAVPSPPQQNHHPTVKPLALMRWLVRLVAPPGGLVLDPFAGSGTTGVACAHEGFRFVGIEQEAEYVEIARARIRHATPPLFAGVA